MNTIQNITHMVNNNYLVFLIGEMIWKIYYRRYFESVLTECLDNLIDPSMNSPVAVIIISIPAQLLYGYRGETN